MTFDRLGWNTEVKKEKLNRRKQRKQRRPGCGFSARLYDQFPFVRATFYELGI